MTTQEINELDHCGEYEFPQPRYPDSRKHEGAHYWYHRAYLEGARAARKENKFILVGAIIGSLVVGVLLGIDLTQWLLRA